MTERVATIDIGSNTLLLLCVENVGGKITRVVDECRFGRLSEGLDKSGRLSERAIERCLDILREYRVCWLGASAGRVRAVATEAVRKAENRNAFVEPAEEILGVPIEVIAGNREAELSCRAVWESLPETKAGTVVICDVGGASTEIIVSVDARIASVQSLPIGAVRLTERHVSTDPPLLSERQALCDDIDAALAPVDLPPGVLLVATAGTATTLGAIDKQLAPYDPDAIHGMSLSAQTVERITDRLFSMRLSERHELRGLDPGRADVIAAGAAIFDRLLKRLGSARCLVSDRGVRWGLAYEMLAE